MSTGSGAMGAATAASTKTRAATGSPLPPLEARALGRALTQVADMTDPFRMPPELELANACWRIGFTGPPGAGKSSLVGRMAVERHPGKRLGVLAIDPSSPVTGGAILGDRLRMDHLPGIEHVFVRSLAARSSTDGLADNLPDLLDLFTTHRFDEVMLETVGVGQPEVAGRSHVDTLVLVLPPDAGDVIQAMKAGILEVADIVVVNKADLPGARRMASNVTESVRESGHGSSWTVPVLLTCQDDAASITAVSQAIDHHRSWLAEHTSREAALLLRERHRTLRQLERMVRTELDQRPGEFFQMPVAQQMANVCAALVRQLDRSSS